jgi:Flp pilus assembly protein TadD
VQGHEFLNLDDDLYVTANPNVKGGLTIENVLWSFRFNEVSYWHPLTWLSHMLDCQLFGLHAGSHHFTSLLIHMANTLILFFSFHRMTGAFWRSSFLAALFALHPVQVESVAWVADRKNVLSTLFWVSTLWAYARYAERPSLAKYLLVLVFMSLGLLAKPMLVTLPFVLLLLDYWPLCRWQPSSRAVNQNVFPFAKTSLPHLVYEKLPLLFLSIAAVSVAYLSSLGMGIVISSENVSLMLRIKNALVSYILYVQKIAMPLDLAFFYPYPKSIPTWQLLSALMGITAITFLVLRVSRRAPYLPVGWLWYLGTLVPVLGLIQQGLWPALADRFLYVPSMGLLLIIVWGWADLATHWRLSRTVIGLSGASVLLAFLVTSKAQVSLWQNSAALFVHALDVTRDNHLAHYNLGATLQKRGEIQKAFFHYQEALRILPDNPQFHNSLGVALIEKSDLQGALFHFNEAIRLFPDYEDAHNNMGLTLSRLGKMDEASIHYQRAIQIRPDEGFFYFNLGNVQSARGDYQEAISSYMKALLTRPEEENLQLNLGYALMRAGRLKEALKVYDEAIKKHPHSHRLRHNREMVSRNLAEAE